MIKHYYWPHETRYHCYLDYNNRNKFYKKCNQDSLEIAMALSKQNFAPKPKQNLLIMYTNRSTSQE
jgi:hypothetical protein